MTYCDWETWQVILREIREGTPDTPQRIAMMKRADEAFRQSMEPTLKRRWPPKPKEE